MPRLFGLNVLGVLVASLAFWVVGFVWYGIVFAEAWMVAEGVTEADAEGQSPIWMLIGFIITVLQVIGIGLVMKWRNISDIGGAVMTGLTLWFFFALAFVTYAYAYLPAHNTELWMIDASHLLVGYLIGAVVLSFFD